MTQDDVDLSIEAVVTREAPQLKSACRTTLPSINGHVSVCQAPSYVEVSPEPGTGRVLRIALNDSGAPHPD